MDDSRWRLLADAVGADDVAEGGRVVTPGHPAGVAAALRVAQEHRIPLRLTSGPGASSQAPPAGAVISLVRLDSVRVDPRNGVARAEAGATLASLAAALAAAGMGVPGLGPGLRSEHVGALVARGGLPRRSLTGLEAALPGGDTVMLGASVLKDVVGYDVTSLLLGSAGRLAAIVVAHLRLIPVAAAVPAFDPPGVHAVDEVAAVFDPRGILAAG